MVKIAFKGVLEEIPAETEAFKGWCEDNGFHYLGSPRRAWCSSLGTYLRGAKYYFHAEAGFSALLHEEDVEYVEGGLS